MIGDEFNLLKRKYQLEKDGLWQIQPGNYIQQMLKAYGEQVEKINFSNYHQTTQSR